MSPTAPLIYIVDDDPAVLRAHCRLVQGFGYRTAAFADAAGFFSAHDPAEPGCVLLDLSMPGVDGVQTQRLLRETAATRAVVFLSGSADIAGAVSAVKEGALDFLLKPVAAEVLRAALAAAVARDDEQRRAAQELQRLQRRWATLTPREREVLPQVIAGLLNKQIAGLLGTSEKTIKVHRARVMEKLGASSLLELARIARLLGIGSAD